VSDEFATHYNRRHTASDALASVAILFAVKNTRLVLIGLIAISVTLAVVLGLALK
jgi:hypothetical protein